MLVRPLFLFLLCACALIASAQAGSDVSAAANRLSSALDNAHAVNFYFVSQTEDHELRGEGFKTASSMKIYRACGGNCKRFMDRVIAHLKQALPVACRPGQEDVLIEPDSGRPLLYSYSGRVIEFEGKCYISKKSINSVIRNADFLFK